MRVQNQALIAYVLSHSAGREFVSYTEMQTYHLAMNLAVAVEKLYISGKLLVFSRSYH
jgi:hypothetical protein